MATALALASLLAGCLDGLPLDPLQAGPSHLDGPYDGSACPSSGQLAVGDTVTGNLGDGDCLLVGGTYADRWELVVERQANFRIDLVSSDFDALLEVFDDRGQWVHGDDDSGEGLNARVLGRLSAGRYSVVARSYGPHSRGAYRLSLGEIGACPEHPPLVLGEAVSGRLDDAPCYYDLWAPADSFTLSVEEEAMLTFAVKSSDGMPQLVVRDERGVHVVEGWAGDDGWIVERATLPAGDYAVYVFRDPYQPPFSFSLVVDAVDCSPRGMLTPSEAVKATLEPSDCSRANGAVWHGWTLEVDEESDVRIDLGSDEFDAFLILRDAQGRLVAEDDDGGPGFDARIERTLPVGVYEVVVTSYRAGQAGAYTLSVDVTPVAGGEG